MPRCVELSELSLCVGEAMVEMLLGKRIKLEYGEKERNRSRGRVGNICITNKLTRYEQDDGRAMSPEYMQSK